MARFVLRFDDVTERFPWDKFDRVEAIMRRQGLTGLVGVVPDCRDDGLGYHPAVDDFWDRVRRLQRSGWTVAQHGYTHEYVSDGETLFGRRRRSEFAGLDLETQMRRLSTGREIMVEQGVWQPVFMAPAHGMDEITLQALRQCGFTFVTDGWGVFPYTVDGITLVPQVFQSGLHFAVGVYTRCLHLGPMSSQELEELCRWIGRNADRIIDFGTAARSIATVPLLASAMRGLTRQAVSAGRSIRTLANVRRPWTIHS